MPYKRVDLIVEAFSKMPDKKLVVIGDGPEFKKVVAKAGPNVTLMGYQSDSVLVEKMRKARAFVFAACEDFGIVPLEAQACGTPVIAYGRGGALETVIDGVSGLFFEEQSVDSICNAVNRFERNQHRYKAELIRRHAQNFSNDRFDSEFQTFMNFLLRDSTTELLTKRFTLKRKHGDVYADARPTDGSGNRSSTETAIPEYSSR